MWNTTVATSLGICRAMVTNPKDNKVYKVDFLVVSDGYTPLLGYKTARNMKLLKINDKNIEQVASVTPVEESTGAEAFDGKLGALPGKVHLQVDDAANPSIMPARRIPIAVSPHLKDELDQVTNLGVITKVNKPTPWASQLVTARKKYGSIRVCINPRELNRALLREHYTLPILEDSLHEL